MMRGLTGAIVGGAIGAVVWALIARFLHVEIGWVAWGIGAAVGGLSNILGGQGKSNGVLCAIIAVASIFVGKMAAIKMDADTATAAVVKKAYEGTEEGAGVSDWEALAKEIREKTTWADAAKGVTQTVSPFDALFALLGIATAFQLGSRPKVAAGPAYTPPTGPLKSEPEEQNPPKTTDQ